MRRVRRELGAINMAAISVIPVEVSNYIKLPKSYFGVEHMMNRTTLA